MTLYIYKSLTFTYAYPLFHSDNIPNPFCDPKVKDKLTKSEKTKEFMEDASFVKVLDDLSKDPQNLVKHMSDHRVMTALAVLLDVDINVPKRKWAVRGHQFILCTFASVTV